MKMTTNDIVLRHNFVSQIQFKDGDSQLSKDLKIKLMSMRIEYGKVHKEFDNDVQEFTKGIISERFNELQRKQDRTEEENTELNKLTAEYNAMTVDYINKLAAETHEVKEYAFDIDEYSEILETNSSNDVEINGQKIKAPDFLEAIYEIFVTKEE